MLNLIKLLNEIRFIDIKTKHDLEAYAKEKWLFYNKKYFTGKLKWGGVYAQKNTSATKLRRLGAYFPYQNYITLHPRLVNAGEKEFIATLLHEMCHQAVHQIDKPSGKYDIHGPLWIKWMKRCKLPTNAIDTNPSISYMDTKEKKLYIANKEKKEKELKNAVSNDIKIKFPHENQPAKYYSPNDNVWYKGLIVCPHDKAGKRWVFITNTVGTSFRMVPNDWFFELSSIEIKEYTKSNWLNKAKLIKNHYDLKSVRRNNRRNRLGF